MSDKEVTLYFSFGSYYSQRALITLYELNIPFTEREINGFTAESYQSWYLKLNPKGQVPTLKYGDTVVTESHDIIQYIHNNIKGGTSPLYPPGCADKIKEVCKTIDELNIPLLTFGSAHHPSAGAKPKIADKEQAQKLKSIMLARPDFLQNKLKEAMEKNPELKTALQAKIKDKAEWIDSLKSPVKYQEVLDHTEKVLNMIEKKLSEGVGDWMFGSFTAADIFVTVLLLRIIMVGFDEKFWGGEKLPKIKEYIGRAVQRDSVKRGGKAPAI